MLSVPAGWAIYLSTSRTSLLAFAILVMLRVIFDRLERRQRPRLTELLTAAIPFLMVCMPMIVMAFSEIYSLRDIPPELASLWIRGNEVFLRPFELMPIFAPNAWLFGFGLGGVGFPVLQSNYSSYAAIIDNFLLFSYYSFGIPFLLLYLAMSIRNCSETDIYKRILFCVTIIFGQFILGWANGMFMLVFGYAASSSFLRGRPLGSLSFAKAHS
jgi:predicted PurR-regulated permease PerM